MDRLAPLLVIFGALAVVFAIVIAWAFWLRGRIRPLLRAFYEQTGYRNVEIPNAAIDEQIRYTQDIKRLRRQGPGRHLVRDFHGVTVHYDEQAHYDAARRTHTMTAEWTVPLGSPARVVWQIADRELMGGAAKAVKEALTRTKRAWQQVYPHAVAMGDAAFDQRFAVLAPDPHAAYAALAQSGLRDLLMACAEVDLRVTNAAVSFSDPAQKNLLAAMGGAVGALAGGLSPAASLQTSIPLHERMCEILARSARAVRG